MPLILIRSNEMISSTLIPKRSLGLRDRLRWSLAYSTLSSHFCCICAIVFTCNSLWASIGKRINPVLGKSVLSLIWDFILWVSVVYHDCIIVYILVCDGGTLPLCRTLPSTNGVIANTLPISFSACSGFRGEVPLFPIPNLRLDTVWVGSKPPIWTVSVYWYALPPMAISGVVAILLWHHFIYCEWKWSRAGDKL